MFVNALEHLGKKLRISEGVTGTLLPAIGISLTPWIPVKEVLTEVVITLLAALWLRWKLVSGGLRVWRLWLNGALYVTYLVIALA